MHAIIESTMSNVIMIDYATLLDDPARIKNFVTEHLVRHQDTLISVLDATPSADAHQTAEKLTKMRFPFDVVVSNPLLMENTELAFKTMFAVSAQDSPDSSIVLVIDKDKTALQMWADSGVKFTYNPETSLGAKNGH